MVYNPEKHHRRSVRLKDYDYALPGGYFITICTHQRACIFGKMINHMMQLNPLGDIVKSHLLDLPTHYSHARIDSAVIMPNHIHAIIELTAYNDPIPKTGDETRPQPRHPLTEIVRGFKTYTARTINHARQSPGVIVWQRSFYDRIIRDEREWLTFRWYIDQNPARWEHDRDYVADN